MDRCDVYGGRAARPTRRRRALWAYRDPAGFQRLMDLLVERFGRVSLGAGGGWCRRAADFRYLGGRLAGRPFERWVIAPTKAIVSG